MTRARSRTLRKESKGIPPEVVNLATVVVERFVTIRDESPEHIQVRVGQPLHLQVPYRYTEASVQEEDVALCLRVRLGPYPEAVRHERILDRRGRSDSRWGTLSVDITPTRPGHHEMAFEVEADYEVTDRREDETLRNQHREKSGWVRVEVID